MSPRPRKNRQIVGLGQVARIDGLTAKRTTGLSPLGSHAPIPNLDKDRPVPASSAKHVAPEKEGARNALPETIFLRSIDAEIRIQAILQELQQALEFVRNIFR
jgi:hypothetical protein